MSNMKSVFAVLVLTVIVGVVPRAHAQATLKLMIAGASGTWQNLAVGTYRGHSCPIGSSAGCSHYTNSKFNLTDTRPTFLSPPGAAVTDTGAIWIVWDNTTADPNCATACNVWAYVKVDSIVGNRCYFAQPSCSVNVNPFPAFTQEIATNIWGADTMPPVPVQALFTTGTSVNVAASEIRPEDALFGQCRINSTLGGGNDGLNGLGYGQAPMLPSGACPAFGAPANQLQGVDLKSAYPLSTSTAHPMAFQISGTDPFTNQAIPAFTTLSIGAVPLIFITNRQGALANVKDAKLTELQTAFSGADCRGSVFTGGTSGNIAVYIREPLSGTMNTAEYSAFRLPRDSSGNYDLVNGASQETGVNSANPVNALPCTAGGNRYSSIGTGEEVKFVLNSNSNFGVDGIGYTFFSYGNVSSIADNAKYAYLTVDGIDPLWQVYSSSPKYDPGQAAVAGELPGTADLTFCASKFPCNESKIWKGGVSFPNLRNGTYRQWAMVRLISDGATLANARTLVSSAQASAVTTAPDYVPAKAASNDKGLFLLRAHYTQDGIAGVNSTDVGGEEGGCILPLGSLATKLVQREPGCVVGP